MSSLKIAFCFSGMIRDLKKTEYFWKQIFDNHNCDIYGHFWDVSDRSEEDNLSNFEKYFHPKISRIVLFLFKKVNERKFQGKNYVAGNTGCKFTKQKGP